MLEMKEILQNFLEQIRQEVIQEQKSQGKYVTGETSNTLQIETSDILGTLYGGISALTLETGRKPGRVPRNFTETIMRWMDNKGLFQSEKNRKSIAYLIGRKIQREGTKLHIEGGGSGVISKAINDDKIQKFANEVLRRFGREIQDQVIIEFGKD